MPTTTITFNGLLVFRHDPVNDLFEVGVLRAQAPPHAHILQITVESDPPTGSDPTITPQQLETYVQAGNVSWNLDVELSGKILTGLSFNANEPANRLDPHPQDDFGWILNIENLHGGGQLKQTPKRLQPVIFLRKGTLFTTCKTDSIDLIQGGEPSTTKEFGFIAGAISLAFDTTAGEEAVLRFDDGTKTTEIFRCVDTAKRDYFVSIMNTPVSGMAGGHFHLFYDRLFQAVPVPDRFDLSQHKPVNSPADRCPEDADPDPNPFKCGGIAVGDGSGPLG